MSSKHRLVRVAPLVAAAVSLVVLWYGFTGDPSHSTPVGQAGNDDQAVGKDSLSEVVGNPQTRAEEPGSGASATILVHIVSGGLPIADGVVVRAIARGVAEPLAMLPQLATAMSGTARLPLPAGTYSISIDGLHVRSEDGSHKQVVVRPSEVKEVLVDAERLSSMSVHVTAPAEIRPQGVRVLARLECDENDRDYITNAEKLQVDVTVQHARDDVYLLDSVVPGIWSLEARDAQGQVDARTQVFVSPGEARVVNMELAGYGALTAFYAAHGACGDIQRIRLYLPDGAGARPRLIKEAGRDFTPGTYTFAHLRAGRYLLSIDYRKTESAGPRTVTVSRDVVIRSGDTSALQLEGACDGRPALDVFVVHEGKPASGGRVEVSECDALDGERQVALADNSGVARLTVPRAGAYTITVTYGAVTTGQRFDLRDGVQSVTVETGAAGVCGVLMNSAGNGVAGSVWVQRLDSAPGAAQSFMSTPLSTREDGSFCLSGLLGGRYVLVGMDKTGGRASRELELRAVVMDVELAIDRTKVVHGVVLDENGVPAEGVRLIEATADGLRGGPSVTLNNGAWSWACLRGAGSQQLWFVRGRRMGTLTLDAHDSMRRRVVKLDQRLGDLVLVPAPKAEVVAVVAAQLTTVAGDISWSPEIVAVNGPTGAGYRITGIPVGKYVLDLSYADGARERVSVSIEGESTDLLIGGAGTFR